MRTRRRSMAWGLVIVLLSAALGAATTVLVSRWVIGERLGVGGGWGPIDGDLVSRVTHIQSTAGVDFHQAVLWGPKLAEYQAMTADELFALVMSSRRAGTVTRREEPWDARLHVAVIDRGWPLRCFDSVLVLPTSTNTWTLLRGGPSRLLGTTPGHVRWGPFVANTGFYAAAWGVLLLSAAAAWSSLRRSRRRRQGRCAACGYSRAGLPVAAMCPECGAREVLSAE